MPTGDDDKLRGKWNETKGKAKRAYGEIAEDREKKAEGTMDKIKGKAQDIKGRVENASDEVRKPDE